MDCDPRKMNAFSRVAEKNGRTARHNTELYTKIIRPTLSVHFTFRCNQNIIKGSASGSVCICVRPCAKQPPLHTNIQFCVPPCAKQPLLHTNIQFCIRPCVKLPILHTNIQFCVPPCVKQPILHTKRQQQKSAAVRSVIFWTMVCQSSVFCSAGKTKCSLNVELRGHFSDCIH